MGKDKTTEVTLAPEAVALVHAFIHVHASKKIAEKFASRFPKLSLDDNLAGAEELANALVTTVKTAVAVPDSAVAKTLGKGDKKDKKRKRESKDKEGTAVQNETATEPANELANESEEPAEKPAEKSEVPEGEGEEEQEKTAENAEETSRDVGSASEPPAKSKKRKDSGIANRFQRVKSDQTVYLDDRLKDMSYAAKVRLC